VSDYGTLAGILRTSGDEEQKHNREQKKHEYDLGAFFEEVKAEIVEEIKKANAELRKQGLTEIERVLVPCYLGRLCLTFGAVLLCCIEFEAPRKLITAVIVGPPNRREISRKEYSLNYLAKPESSSHQGDHGYGPEQSPAAVAGEIVSEILECGIRLMQKPPQQSGIMADTRFEAHFAEFWISLASLLRSYTALHGMSGDRHADIQASSKSITIRHDKKSLVLERDHANVMWARENGKSGALEFTDHGTLLGDAGEEPMDLFAERWARELMLDGEGT
jgi:hypothetical protein